MNSPVFQTLRLHAYKISLGDETVFQEVYSDPEAVRWVGDGKPISNQESALWVDVTLANYRERGYGMYKLIDPERNALIGCCGIVHPSKQNAPEIKYCLLKTQWGQGYATEIVHSLLAYGKRELGLESFVATVAPENKASQKVLLKSGFQLGKTIEDEDGEPTFVFFYGDPEIQNQL